MYYTYVSILHISFLFLGLTFCACVSSYYFYLLKLKGSSVFYVP